MVVSRSIRDSLPAIITSLVVSGCGGTLGIYVGFRLVEQRVARAESDIEDLRDEAKDIRVEAAVDRALQGKIAADVSYIRGLLERKALD